MGDMKNVVPRKVNGKILYRHNVKQNLAGLDETTKLEAISLVLEVKNADKFTLKNKFNIVFYSHTKKGMKSYGVIFKDKFILILKVIDTCKRRIVHWLSVVNTCRLFINDRSKDHDIINNTFDDLNEPAYIHSRIDTENIMHWDVIFWYRGKKYMSVFKKNLTNLYDPFLESNAKFRPRRLH